MDVVVVGSALVDIVVRVSSQFKMIKNFKKYLSIPYGSKIETDNIEFHIGGSGHNVAVGLAKFSHKVSFVGKVGNDYFGKQIAYNFKMHGVSSENLKVVENGRTALSIVFLSPNGEKSLVVYNGFNLDLTAKEIPKDVLKDSEWFVFTSITSKKSLEFLKRAINFAKRNDVKVLANPSIRMVRVRRKELTDLIRNSDVAIMNEEEINELTRCKNTTLSIKKLYRLGAKLVVVTLGANGSIAYDGAKIYRQGGFKVKVLDSTGCGDSFTAGFLHCILKRKEISEVLKFANATAALKVQNIGATENLPSERDVLSFISKYSVKPR